MVASDSWELILLCRQVYASQGRCKGETREKTAWSIRSFMMPEIENPDSFSYRVSVTESIAVIAAAIFQRALVEWQSGHVSAPFYR